MRQFIFEKNLPSLAYIINNWPNTKHLLKKFILSNQKKPNFYKLCISCLNELNVYKIGNFKEVIKILSKKSSMNFTFNSYHDQHHFKSVIIISCLLAKLSNFKAKEDIIWLILIALTHDLFHQGRRIIKTSYYQEEKSFKELYFVAFKKLLNHKKFKRFEKIFRSTYFPIKPEKVDDELEKIILDADILASLMFGMKTGIKLAERLKHEIRFEGRSDVLFGGFLKFLSTKDLYLKSSKNSC